MKLLVIGSKGFIGATCYAHFKHTPGFEVFGADVVVDYTDQNYFLVDSGDINFRRIFRVMKFDICINCAGAASVPDSFKNPRRDFMLNVHLTAQLLDAIREENPSCKMVQISSAAVYGNPAQMPVTEHTQPLPISPYGIHKKHAEELCRLYHDFFGIDTVVTRIFSAFGDGLRKQLFWDLYQKTLHHDQIMLSGTGEETREFIHVSDIANAIEVILRSAVPGFTIINIANGKPITIREAAGVFLRHIGFAGALTFTGNGRTGDPLFWHAGIAKLNSFGYQQRVSFEKGIVCYCKWLKEKG